MIYLLVIGAYLLGSIPFGLLLGKKAGLDIRLAGSGNVGATNVTRLLGRKLGVLTLLLDAGKAVVPLIAASVLLAGPAREPGMALCGAAAFLGHIWPVYLKFKGGKGVATALGIFLYLEPLSALLTIAVFIAVVANWGFVSLGSLAAALLLPGFIWLISASLTNTLLALLISALIWLKHRDNITRLREGTEKSWRRSE
jgi:acyl phosphate:glycerol-3-phosphate acyltransferase